MTDAATTTGRVLATALLARLPDLEPTEQRARLQVLDDVEDAVATEAALGLLEAMDDATGVLAGMAAARVLRWRGTADQAERLSAAVDRLPSFRGLRDWRTDARAALAALDALARGGCRCASVHATNTAPGGPLFTVEDTRRGDYRSESDVRCTACGAGWRVTRDDSYHYPVFGWSRSG